MFASSRLGIHRTNTWNYSPPHFLPRHTNLNEIKYVRHAESTVWHCHIGSLWRQEFDHQNIRYRTYFGFNSDEGCRKLHATGRNQGKTKSFMTSIITNSIQYMRHTWRLFHHESPLSYAWVPAFSGSLLFENLNETPPSFSNSSLFFG